MTNKPGDNQTRTRKQTWWDKLKQDPERLARHNKKKMEHWHRSEATRKRQAEYTAKRFQDPEYRSARNKANTEWRLNNLEKDREQKRRSAQKCRKQNKGRHRRACLKHRYGITGEDFSEMLGRQMCLCAGCRRPMTMVPHRFDTCCVDHCHETGKVRGLLCKKCNVALGHMDDDPNRLRALAAYLETP